MTEQQVDQYLEKSLPILREMIPCWKLYVTEWRLDQTKNQLHLYVNWISAINSNWEHQQAIILDIPHIDKWWRNKQLETIVNQ